MLTPLVRASGVTHVPDRRRPESVPLPACKAYDVTHSHPCGRFGPTLVLQCSCAWTVLRISICTTFQSAWFIRTWVQNWCTNIDDTDDVATHSHIAGDLTLLALWIFDLRLHVHSNQGTSRVALPSDFLVDHLAGFGFESAAVSTKASDFDQVNTHPLVN